MRLLPFQPTVPPLEITNRVAARTLLPKQFILQIGERRREQRLLIVMARKGIGALSIRKKVILPGDGHKEWLERKKLNREQRRQKKDGYSNGQENQQPGKKLSLSDAMKKVMTTKMNCSGAEFRKLMDEAKSLTGEDF